MTPAKLQALIDMDVWANTDRGGGKRKAKPSSNPAADLAALAAM